MLYMSKSKWSAAYFQYTSIVFNLAYNKNKPYKNLDNWSRYVLNFDFLEKGLGIVSPPRFVFDVSRKMFLMLYSINCLISLPLLLGQYVYCNCLLTRLCHKFWNWPYLSNQPVFLHDHFSSFEKGFQLPKIISDLSVRLWDANLKKSFFPFFGRVNFFFSKWAGCYFNFFLTWTVIV